MCVCVGVCFSLIFVWHLSLLYLQDGGGAIYNTGGDGFTIEGSATFMSCSAVASSSASSYGSFAVSIGE